MTKISDKNHNKEEKLTSIKSSMRLGWQNRPKWLVVADGVERVGLGHHPFTKTYLLTTVTSSHHCVFEIDSVIDSHQSFTRIWHSNQNATNESISQYEKFKIQIAHEACHSGHC